MRRWRLVLPLFVACAFAFAQENESERILSYTSDITVNGDASLTVRETIRVYVLNEEIKHGISREFPTNYKSSVLTRFITTFELEDVKLDGEFVPHREEMKTNGVVTYIGDPDTYVSRGEHTYTIGYRTRHQLAYWNKHDELYWNVTGNGWAFPIEQAEAYVHLPQAVPPNQLEVNGYTGLQGAKEQAYEWNQGPDGTVRLRTTRSLQEKEGFTISVIFPRGLIARPSLSEEIGKWASDNRALRMGLFGTALTLAYFIFVWFLVGRDPARGEISVLSEPPKAYSPAAARYLTRMGFDNQTFAVTLLSLAVKKYVELSQGDKYITVKRLDKPAADCSAEEKAVFQKLFSSSNTLTLKQQNHKRVADALKACHDNLRNQYERRYFLTNLNYSFPGTILAVLTVAASLYYSPVQADVPVVFLGIWLTFWTFGCVLLGHAVVSAWRLAFKGVGQFAGAVFITLFASPFFAAEIFVTAVMFSGSAFWVFPLIVLLSVMNWWFYQLMKAPTKLGRRALDEIEGFRAYLEGAQRTSGAANLATPNTDEFNRHFPYAAALDLDEAWTGRFAEAFAGADRDDPRLSSCEPYWYRGNMWKDRGMRGFSTAITSVMAAEIASSSTAPGKSSGGSSGGFSGGSSGGSSGGGGGGGGGGGW